MDRTQCAEHYIPDNEVTEMVEREYFILLDFADRMSFALFESFGKNLNNDFYGFASVYSICHGKIDLSRSGRLSGPVGTTAEKIW